MGIRCGIDPTLRREEAQPRDTSEKSFEKVERERKERRRSSAGGSRRGSRNSGETEIFFAGNDLLGQHILKRQVTTMPSHKAQLSILSAAMSGACSSILSTVRRCNGESFDVQC